MILWLIGMMGSGKTSAGRLAASRLGVAFTDTDEAIVAREGRPVGAIWETSGEPAFRGIEREVVKELAGGDGICATGGGVVLDAENRSVMRESGRIVWLEAAPETLAARLAHNRSRPALLSGEATAEEVLTNMLEDRSRYYEESADVRLPTEGFDVEEIALEIEALWKD